MAGKDQDIKLVKSYAPNTERMVRAILIALDLTPEEIDHFFREDERLLDYSDKEAA